MSSTTQRRRKAGEVSFTKNVLAFTGATIFLGGLSVGGATALLATKGSVKEAHTIPACPAAYTKHEEPVANPIQAQQSLQEGVSTLVSKLPQTHTYGTYDVELPTELRGAATSILKKYANQRLVDASATFIDLADATEVFCRQDDRMPASPLYLSPAANTMVGALHSADITVTTR